MNENRHRRSIRIKGYDYASLGAYFVTICTQDRACLFGEVTGGAMRLNAIGEIVRAEWFKTAELRPYVRLDEREFVVMPNHVHGIIWIVDHNDGNDVGARCRDNDNVGAQRRCAPTRSPAMPNVVPGSIGAIIRAFKSAVTKRINDVRGTPGAAVWQRNYYEHVIRDDESLNRIRRYIMENPLRWASDRENPMVTGDAGGPSYRHAQVCRGGTP